MNFKYGTACRKSAPNPGAQIAQTQACAVIERSRRSVNVVQKVEEHIRKKEVKVVIRKETNR